MPPNREPALALLGVRIHALPAGALIERITAAAQHNERAIAAYVNAHSLNLAHESPALRRFFNERAAWVFCDGFGVKWGARLAGQPQPLRYTPPDWIDPLCCACAQRGLSIFLLGDKPETVEKAAHALQARHADLRIAGWQHGFFNKDAGSAENDAVIQAINHAQPDVLLVGFGQPLQELWLDANWAGLNAPAALTVGALFSYVAGDVQRAPRWMTDHGLEWLGRLLIEPRRLWQRYLVGLPVFFARVLAARMGLSPTQPPPTGRSAHSDGSGSG
jgi:N-acetylglucosaminyldiphosphoundecaprenol N-acetyl-beta-D-mannosaminyltransferase